MEDGANFRINGAECKKVQEEEKKGSYLLLYRNLATLVDLQAKFGVRLLEKHDRRTVQLGQVVRHPDQLVAP